MTDGEHRIGGYRTGPMIGQGAMGRVFSGTDEEGNRVAVKLLHLHLTEIEEFVKRFHREARLARRLAHPNVVRILDSGEEGGQHYIVMEYVEGETLAELLKEAGIESPSAESSGGGVDDSAEGSESGSGTSDAGDGHSSSAAPVLNLPIEQVIHISRQVAGVLQAASDIGLVHRDLKPQNILIDPAGNAKVLDFGLAKDTQALASFMSMTGQSIGTPPYMSPEQCEGSKEIDVRTDLYSLGATMYQMLTGRAPFEGPTVSAYARQHLEQIPEPAGKVNPAVPRNLSQVIERLLAKDPADRHQNPAELIEDLNRVERGEVPLKRYRPRKIRKWKVWHAAAAAFLAVALTAGGFSGWLWYRGTHARAVVEEHIEQARFAADRGQLDEALSGLDEVIRNFRVDYPATVEGACKLREEIRQRKIDEERARLLAERKREQERLDRQRELTASGDKALTDRDYASALVFYEQAAALGQTKEIADKIDTATRWKEETAAEAEKQARLAREAAERKAAAEEAERERKLELDRALETAERFLEDGDEDTLDQAREHAGRARELARSQDEIDKALALQDQVSSALRQRRPWAGVVDFTMDPSVKEDLTGSAVAIKIEQALSGTYRLVTRSQVVRALEELKFQSGDLADPDKAQIFGKQIGAEYLIAGSVVQIGDEITVAAQTFRVETGAIRQTADNTALSLKEMDTAFFSEIAHIIEMTDSEKQRYLDEKRNYPKYLSQGKSFMAADNYPEAVKALETARRAKRTPEVESLLATAREKAEEFRILSERRAAHNLALAEGSRLLREEKWTEAEAAFSRALEVTGWEQSAEAHSGIEKARGGAALAQFERAAAEGRKLLNEKRWAEAEAAFTRALAVDGYVDAQSAKNGLSAARFGQALDRAEAHLQDALKRADTAKTEGDWEAVAAVLSEVCSSSYRRSLPTDNGNLPERLQTLLQACNTLAEEADGHLTPRVKIISVIDGQEVPGAEITCNGIAQKAATPATFKLEKAKSYTFSVAMPPRSGKHYTTFTEKYRADKNGLAEIRAVLKETHGPAQGTAWTVPELGLEFVWVDALNCWVGKYEVTNAEYRAKDPNHDSGDRKGHSLNGDRQPVVEVNFDDACAYAEWLTARERRAGRLPDGLRYRLPAEDEWMTFAQCGDNREYPWGDGWPPQSGQAGNYDDETEFDSYRVDGNYRDGHMVSCNVSDSWRNPWGLYGVGGNVWECCAEGSSEYQSFGAWRGGSWYGYLQDFLRCSFRDFNGASIRFISYGFRLLLSH